MPIDPSKALAAEFPSQRAEWGPDDVILYHLGLGAGFEKPTDAKELEYTYEQNLKVLPSYGVIPVFGALSGLGGMPGVEINFAMVLHGEQDLVIHRPIPVSGVGREQAPHRGDLGQGQGRADRHGDRLQR